MSASELTMESLLQGTDYTRSTFVIEDTDSLPAPPLISALAYRSADVCPGGAFFCIRGQKTDGHRFAADALMRGAVALVVDHVLTKPDIVGNVPEGANDSFVAELERKLDSVTQYVVADTREALALSSCRFYDDPSEDLCIAGITGTNGKTTTTYLLDWIFASSGKRTGMIGTVGARIGDETQGTDHTTPEALDLQHLFSQMVAHDVTHVSMEVSSHAIDLKRTWGTRFAVVAFSNLTQDHLDYHHTFEEYFEAKAKLFTDYDVAHRVICIDDAWGEELYKRCVASGYEVRTVSGLGNPEADLFATSVDLGARETTFTLVASDVRFDVRLPLAGLFNVSNALLAIGCAQACGITIQDAVTAIASAPQTPGRLERVEGRDAPFSVFVDYAHTPDSVAKSIQAVKTITPGRTIVVFGCGGDRDRAKRPLMGRAALAADTVIVTSDNPRSEDPHAIIRDILAGIEGDERIPGGGIEVLPDRREAISYAIGIAQKGDAVLIAGKGHEDYQLVGDQVLDFDDRVVAAEELRRACS